MTLELSTTEPERESINAIFRRLQDLDRSCGPDANKHDRATVLIIGCIREGWNTRPQIVGILRKLGFEHGHVAKWLNMHTGNDPARHWWRRDESGVYTLHDS